MKREEKRQGNKRLLIVMAQAFYGNRVITETTPDHIDALVLGWTCEILVKDEKINRKILPIPGSDQVVLVYRNPAEPAAGRL